MGARRIFPTGAWLGHDRHALRRGHCRGKIQLEQCPAVPALWHSRSSSVQYRFFSWFIFVRSL